MAEYSETIEFGADFTKLNKQVRHEGQKVEAGLKQTFGKGLARIQKLQDAMERGTSGQRTFDRVGGLRARVSGGRLGGSTRSSTYGGGEGEEKFTSALLKRIANNTEGDNGSGRPRKGGGGESGGKGKGGGSDVIAGALGGLGTTAILSGVQALGEALHNVVETADAAGNSKIFDVQTYGRLAAAAKKGQTDIGTLDTTASKLANTLAQSKLPPEFARGLQAVAVSADELKKLSPEQQFGLLADRVSDFTNPADQAAVAMKLFGESGSNLLPFLRQGSAGIKAAADQAEKYGAVVTTDAVEATKKYKDAVDTLSLRGQGLATNLGTTLLPVLADGADWFGKLADNVGPSLDGALERIGETFDWLGDVANTAGEYIGPIFGEGIAVLMDIVDRVQGTLEGLADKFGLAGDGAQDATVWIGETLVSGVDLAGEAFLTVYDTIDPVVTIIADLVGLIGDLIVGGEETTGVFSGLTDAAIGLVDGALSYVQATLETISDIFDAFGSGDWEQGFMNLGQALLDFILEPLRSIVSTVVTIADSISSDLVPENVREFANGGKIRSLAAEATEEKTNRRTEASAKRETARTEREQKRIAELEERQRAKEEKDLGIIGPQQEKIDAKRLAALKQTDAKLTGETLSLGARDDAGRMIELYLGAGDKVAAKTRAKYAAAANMAREAIMGRDPTPRDFTTPEPSAPLRNIGGGGREVFSGGPRVPLSPSVPLPSAPIGHRSTLSAPRVSFEYDIDVVVQGETAASSLDSRRIRTLVEQIFKERQGSEVRRAQQLAQKFIFNS